MADTNNPLLTLDLGENGGQISFYSFDEISAWVSQEREHWSWIAQHGYGGISDAWQRINQSTSEIQQSINNARNNQNAPTFENHLIDIRQRIIGTIGANSFPEASTAKAKFIDALKQENPLVAAFALAYFCGHANTQNMREAIRGQFEAILFEKGLNTKLSVAAEKKSLSQVYQEFRQQLDQDKVEATRNQGDFDSLVTMVRELHDSQQATFTGVVNKSNERLDAIAEEEQTKLDQLFEAKHAELENLTKTYEEKLALQAPVKYWKAKKIKHRWLAIGFGLTLVVAMILSGIFGVREVNSLFAMTKPGQSPDHWRIAGMLVIAALDFWAIRILVRLFLSQIHLQTDADERVTMVQTYLSLTRKGVIPESEDRQLILQSLFRSAATGIVKDDAAPPNFIEMITRTSK